MKILLIDTSSFFVTIAITTGNQVDFIYQEEIKDDMSSKIMPIIRRALIECKITLNDIDKFMVCVGPGSFTGIRIGVTIAKVLAWSLKKELIGISTLELYASTKFDTKYIIPMIDARRGFVYAGVYDKELNCIKKEQYIEYKLLEEFFNDATLISYDNLALCSRPCINILNVINKHVNDNPINVHNVNPNYLKKTEAEENLRKKNND